jgi:hypothetical protein
MNLATKKSDEAADSSEAEKMATKIVITKRGNCSFVTKVGNAERSGASLLVVVDNNLEDVKNVIMGDDGTGTGIRIPSMLIGKE